MAPETPASTAEVPGQGVTPFGKYVLARRLAVGGTSEVYLAYLAADRDAPPVVVKRLLPASLSDPSALGMFATEARLHRAISHPNVVKVFEAGVVDGEPYLAMEYIDGVDAARLARRARNEHRRIPLGLAIYIARSLADALASVHEARDEAGNPLGVLHRDITPSNIYLGKDGDVRLGDFGIARSGVGRQSRGSVGAGIKGKYGYLSPEQVCGEPCDQRSDLFSLAVVTCELVLGQPLFPGAGQLAVLLAIRDGRIDALHAAKDKLPLGLFEVLVRALAREPGTRFPTARELSAALAPYEGATPAENADTLRDWVAWARDSQDLAKRLSGAIRESSDRLRAAQDTTLDEGVEPATWPRANPAEPKTLTRTPSSEVLLAPPPPSGVTPSERTTARPPPGEPPDGFGPEPVTVRFDETPSRVRVAFGEEIGPLTFARIIEMIFTGEIGPEDEVDLMGQGFRRVAQIELLARHLPDESTTRSLRTPELPDATIELGETTLLAALGRFARDAETGFLLVSGSVSADDPPLRREVYLKNGTLHHVGSSDASEMLGQSLVRRGVITEPELDMALAVLAKFDGRLGDTLIALGLVDAMELFRAIEEQGKERLVRAFAWGHGRLTFYRNVLPARVEFPLELDLADLMLAGVEAAMPNDTPIERHRTSLDRKLRRTRPTAGQRRRGPLPRPLVVFMDALGSGMDLKHVLMRLNTTGALATADALRAMEVALALGLVEHA